MPTRKFLRWIVGGLISFSHGWMSNSAVKSNSIYGEHHQQHHQHHRQRQQQHYHYSIMSTQIFQQKVQQDSIAENFTEEEKSQQQQQQQQKIIHKEPIQILDQGQHYLVASKPPAVVCHHSDWTGSRSSLEVPMLQRVRDTVGERVNLIHRLDRGASGCLLFSFAKSDVDGFEATRILSEAMPNAQKTYIALVRGEGVVHGRDYKKEGWFEVSRPVKDENGILNDATTMFRFIAGQDNGHGTIDRPRAGLVLARPKTGRWHQIRRHLNGLSQPILGDTIHGNSKINREWRLKRGLPPERTCLHLLEIQFPSTCVNENGFTVTCPLAPDMMELLETHLPQVLTDAEPKLREEGLCLRGRVPDGDGVV